MAENKNKIIIVDMNDDIPMQTFTNKFAKKITTFFYENVTV